MELGIRGRKALVCAGSRGLGRACAAALAAEGVGLTITGRDADSLARTADEIATATGQPVAIVPGDIATEQGRAAALEACPDADILVTNAGGPPLARFETLQDADWHAALEANMLSPLALIRALQPGMRQRGFGRIVAITTALIKSPSELLSLSVGARAGLTGAISWLAREGVVDNVTINTLMPEMIFTDRMRTGFAAMAEHAGQAPESFVADFRNALPAKRFGTPEEFGAFCAFLCSAQAGYVTNQHILVDGGHYQGLF